MSRKCIDEEVLPSFVSTRLSLLKINGGDFTGIWDVSKRFDNECIQGCRSRSARHSCKKNQVSYRPYRRINGKPIDLIKSMVQPIQKEVSCESQTQCGQHVT